MTANSHTVSPWNLFAASVRAAASGRWAPALPALGIPAKFLSNRHGPCPGCGGKDRFRFDDRDGKGSFVCSQGGGKLLAGDGFSLVMHVTGCDFRTAVTHVGDVLGIVPPSGCGEPRWAGSRKADELRRAVPGAQDSVDLAQRRLLARKRAARIWQAAEECESHPYLERKRIQPHGTRLHRGLIVVPLRDEVGELHSLEFIAADGTKRFLKGGRMLGCAFILGKAESVICIAEGFATAASIHEATGSATVCSFSACNLKPVAKAMRAQHADARIVLCADDDPVGRAMALEAARAIGGFIAQPGVLGGAA